MSVVMLNAIILTVIMLSIVVPLSMDKKIYKQMPQNKR